MSGRTVVELQLCKQVNLSSLTYYSQMRRPPTLVCQPRRSWAQAGVLHYADYISPLPPFYSKSKMLPIDYLLRPAEREINDRHQRMVELRIRAACFPTTEGLDTFDFPPSPSGTAKPARPTPRETWWLSPPLL